MLPTIMKKWPMPSGVRPSLKRIVFNKGSDIKYSQSWSQSRSVAIHPLINTSFSGSSTIFIFFEVPNERFGAGRAFNGRFGASGGRVKGCFIWLVIKIPLRGHYKLWKFRFEISDSEKNFDPKPKIWWKNFANFVQKLHKNDVFLIKVCSLFISSS